MMSELIKLLVSGYLSVADNSETGTMHICYQTCTSNTYNNIVQFFIVYIRDRCTRERRRKACMVTITCKESSDISYIIQYI